MRRLSSLMSLHCEAGGSPSDRGVVLTASYEARPYGVGSAMPMAKARRKCPNALIIPPRFDRYQQVSKMIMGVFADFSPHVEALSLDEAFLDMTGSEELFGAPELIGHRLKMAIRDVTGGLTASVGPWFHRKARKPGSRRFPCLGYGVSAPKPKTGFTNWGCIRSAVWPRLIRDYFPPSSGAPAFTPTPWPTRVLGSRMSKSIGQRTRSIGTSARSQISNFTCGDQPT